MQPAAIGIRKPVAANPAAAPAGSAQRRSGGSRFPHRVRVRVRFHLVPRSSGLSEQPVRSTGCRCAIRVLDRAKMVMPSLVLIRADAADSRRAQEFAARARRSVVQAVAELVGRAGFVPLPRRWVVQRTHAWITGHRRMSRDYERLPAHAEAMIKRAIAGPPPPSRSRLAATPCGWPVPEPVAGGYRGSAACMGDERVRPGKCLGEPNRTLSGRMPTRSAFMTEH